LIRSDVSGERFILNGMTSSYGDLFRRVGAAMDLQKRYTVVPKWMMKHLDGLFQTLKGKGLSSEMIDQMYGSFLYDSSKSKTLPGYDYTTYDTTINDVVTAFRQPDTPGVLPF